MNNNMTKKANEDMKCLFCNTRTDMKLITEELPHKPICKDCYLDDVYIGKEYCDDCGKPNDWAECPNVVDCEQWHRRHCNTIECSTRCIV